jgi:hypothetical protein
MINKPVMVLKEEKVIGVFPSRRQACIATNISNTMLVRLIRFGGVCRGFSYRTLDREDRKNA